MRRVDALPHRRCSGREIPTTAGPAYRVKQKQLSTYPPDDWDGVRKNEVTGSNSYFNAFPASILACLVPASPA
jgi:hypothetical protein